MHSLFIREEIFEIHTRSMRESGSLAPEVNCKDLAANTTRFSGAEIAGVVRAAASYAIDRQVSHWVASGMGMSLLGCIGLSSATYT